MIYIGNSYLYCRLPEFLVLRYFIKRHVYDVSQYAQDNGSIVSTKFVLTIENFDHVLDEMLPARER